MMGRGAIVTAILQINKIIRQRAIFVGTPFLASAAHGRQECRPYIGISLRHLLVNVHNRRAESAESGHSARSFMTGTTNCALITIISLLLTACSYSFNVGVEPAHVITSTSPVKSATAIPTAIPTVQPVQSTSTLLHIKLYLVALNNGGQIGCGDSLVAVEQDIPHTESPLKDTLNALFAIKSQYYGQSGLYNALYNSTLTVQGISAHDGIFKVDLIGQFNLGGECDDPRAKAQIKQTILQFNTVKEANVFVNGKPLEQVLSGRG